MFLGPAFRLFRCPGNYLTHTHDLGFSPCPAPGSRVPLCLPWSHTWNDVKMERNKKGVFFENHYLWLWRLLLCKALNIKTLTEHLATSNSFCTHIQMNRKISDFLILKQLKRFVKLKWQIFIQLTIIWQIDLT